MFYKLFLIWGIGMKLKMKYGLFTASCILFAQVSMAEDLMQIYQKSILNDPQMLGASHTRLAAGEAVDEAIGRMLPQLSFEYSKSETEQDVKETSNAFFNPVDKTDYDTTEYSLTLTQSIFNWGNYSSYEQAKSSKLRANAEWISQKQDLMLRTTEAYLEVLAAADEISFVTAEKTAVKKQLELVQAMMRGGMARKTELYDARARYASVEADEISASLRHDDKLEGLREIVGVISGDLAKLKPDLTLVEPTPKDPNSWMESAVRQNPRVILHLRAVDVSRHEISLQKAGHMPTLDLTARRSNRDDLERISGNKSETSDVLLTFRMPLYQGGIVNSRMRRSQQLHQKAKQDLNEMRRSVQRSARAAYHGIISAISKVEALDKSVKSQRLALQSKQGGFRSGLYTGLDVLDAERDVYEAKRDYSRARYDYLLNGLRLKHAVGTINENDIKSINVWLQHDNQASTDTEQKKYDEKLKAGLTEFHKTSFNRRVK